MQSRNRSSVLHGGQIRWQFGKSATRQKTQSDPIKYLAASAHQLQALQDGLFGLFAQAY